MRKYKSIQGAARNIQGAVSGGGRSVHMQAPGAIELYWVA